MDSEDVFKTKTGPHTTMDRSAISSALNPGMAQKRTLLKDEHTHVIRTAMQSHRQLNSSAAHDSLHCTTPHNHISWPIHEYAHMLCYTYSSHMVPSATVVIVR